jgi:hypothetical protein
MVRLAAPLSIAAIAVLGACAAPPPQQGGPAVPSPKIVTNVHPYYVGTGVVQAVMPAPAMAGAGSSAEPLQRLEIKMDNGPIQYVDIASRDFQRGTRVRLTEDKILSRL